ncbi:MAG: hypothetical protein EOM55_00080 [Clostridia bacterium]|nr:hypothetical protein [Clostridia bacterium]
MEKEKEREIIETIKRDDLAFFSQLFSQEKLLNISFGRFPILSICYLYNAKKIIKNFERKLLRINNFERVSEPFSVYKDFKNYAKKSVRLYFSDESIISPLEMLAILHFDGRLEKVYKFAYINDIITKNLTKIYSTFYGQDISFKNGKIKVGLKIISKEEKSFLKRCLMIFSIFIFCLVGAMTAIDFTLGGVAFLQAKVYSSSQFVSALSSNCSAVLQNDLTLSNSQFLDTFSGEIDGNGHTIYVNYDGKNLIENNSGTIENLKIVYQNFNEETTLSSSSSLLCGTNSGTISNVEIEFAREDLTDKIAINIEKNTNGSYFSGFAVTNSGEIKNCNILLSISISGSGTGDGNVSGIASKNSGIIFNCSVLATSVIDALEVDVSGIIASNISGGKVENCTNNASLTQTSDEDNWSPTVAGIVGINNGEINSCRNVGVLKVTSTFSEASTAVAICGGIVGSNEGIIKLSKNVGNIEVTTNTLSVYCGGVVAYNFYDLTVVCLQNCGQEGEISVVTAGENAKAYVGGIAGHFYGQLTECFSLATFVTAFDETKNYVGASFGSIWYLSNIQYINGSNNYVLTSESVEKQIGVMVLNSSVYSYDVFGYDTGTNSSTGNQVVISMSSISDIKNLGVYFE